MKRYEQAMIQVHKFNTEGAARRFADSATKIHQIVLGDDGLFWVTLPRWAAELERLGYEIL